MAINHEIINVNSLNEDLFNNLPIMVKSITLGTIVLITKNNNDDTFSGIVLAKGNYIKGVVVGEIYDRFGKDSFELFRDKLVLKNVLEDK